MADRKFVVGVIGTQNTGKSTFIRDLIVKYKGTENEFHTVGCDYRKKIEEAGLSINRKGNLAAQRIILDTLVEQVDIIRGMEAANYVTDRTPIDALVYTEYLYKHNPELGITQSDLDEMLEKVKKSMSGYDLIVFLDLDDCGNVEVVDDKFRDTDLDYRSEIDSIFKETLVKIRHEIFGKLDTCINGSRMARVDLFEIRNGFRFHKPIEETFPCGNA